MSSSHRWLLLTVTILAIVWPVDSTNVASAQDNLDRTTLPIQIPTYKAITGVDTPQRFVVKAFSSEPNLVIVLIEDIGFGSLHLKRVKYAG